MIFKGALNFVSVGCHIKCGTSMWLMAHRVHDWYESTNDAAIYRPTATVCQVTSCIVDVQIAKKYPGTAHNVNSCTFWKMMFLSHR